MRLPTIVILFAVLCILSALLGGYIGSPSEPDKQKVTDNMLSVECFKDNKLVHKQTTDSFSIEATSSEESVFDKCVITDK